MGEGVKSGLKTLLFFSLFYISKSLEMQNIMLLGTTGVRHPLFAPLLLNPRQAPPMVGTRYYYYIPSPKIHLGL